MVKAHSAAAVEAVDYNLSSMGKTTYRKCKRLASEASADEDAVVRQMGIAFTEALLAGQGSVRLHKEHLDAAYEASQAARATEPELRQAAAELKTALGVSRQLPSGVAIARGRLREVQSWV